MTVSSPQRSIVLLSWSLGGSDTPTAELRPVLFKIFINYSGLPYLLSHGDFMISWLPLDVSRKP